MDQILLAGKWGKSITLGVKSIQQQNQQQAVNATATVSPFTGVSSDEMKANTVTLNESIGMHNCDKCYHHSVVNLARVPNSAL